jgi:hypothetical protein
VAIGAHGGQTFVFWTEDLNAHPDLTETAIVMASHDGAWNVGGLFEPQLAMQGQALEGLAATAQSSDGAMHVAWTEVDNWNAEQPAGPILVARLDGGGWSTPGAIPGSHAYLDSLALKADAQGDLVAVWISAAADSGDAYAVGDVLYAVGDGHSWSTPRTELAVAGDARQLAFDQGASGELVASWVGQSPGGNSTLHAAVWNGTAWTTPRQVGAAGVISQVEVGIVNGQTTLLWTEHSQMTSGAIDHDLVYATYDGNWTVTNWSAVLPLLLASCWDSMLDPQGTWNGGALGLNNVPLLFSSIANLGKPPEDCCKCEKIKEVTQGQDEGCGFHVVFDEKTCTRTIVYTPCVVQPSDPNDILGPIGFGEENWITADRVLDYTIRFENEPTATAPAQQVFITQQLDPDLDPRTFRLADFGWSGMIFSPPANTPFLNQSIDLVTSHGFVVNVVAFVDIANGEIQWIISTLDPTTGTLPLDPFTGFLPINDEEGIGEGFVSYTIRAHRDVPTGTVIDAQARIVFDTEEPIDTPPIFNTLDAVAPTSQVDALPAITDDEIFTVSWSGSDDEDGAGIRGYTLFVSTNGGPFEIWLENTTLTEAAFVGQPGASYAFYSVASDNAANFELPPETPDAETLVGGGVGAIGDFVWLDANANGIQDDGEPGLANVTVRLYVTDGELETLLDTATTDEQGLYLFEELDLTLTYFLEFVLPDGHAFGPPGQGEDDALDSDVIDALTGRTAPFTILVGDNLHWDVGLIPLGTIEGLVWHDENGNGLLDDEEAGLAGWDVFLDLDDNGQWDEGEPLRTTDEQGRYRFEDLLPGTYIVAQTIPAGWIQTLPGPSGATGMQQTSSEQPSYSYTGSSISLLTPGEVSAEDSGLSEAASLVKLDAFQADSRFVGIDGSGYSVVVIDTGINLNHPFFGPDSNGDGVADRIVFHYDFADRDDNARDMHGHGSHVASTIASQDPIHQGLAPGVNIIALKVFSDSGRGYFSYLEQALQWVVEHAAAYNVVAVNLSVGDGLNWSQSVGLYGISDELARLAAMDVLVVAAAGNSFGYYDGRQGVAYPAADPHTLAVGAVWDSNRGGPWTFGGFSTDYTTAADRIASFSQRHPTLLDVFAPGALITGADASGGTTAMRGTSMAAPHVTGAAILAQQLAEEHLGRRLSVGEFRTLLTSSGVWVVDGDDEDDNVPNTGLSFARLDMHALAQAVVTFDASATPGIGTPGGGAGGQPIGSLNTRPFRYTIELAPGQARENVDFGNQQFLPAIHIEKHTNGLDADDEPGPIVPVGGTVTFTYTVTNTGNVPLPNVVVVDDAGTPDDITDDFSPSFVGGDENENGVLDPGEVWTYSATHIVTAGQYVNLGTVTAGDESTGTATASDLSHHFGAAAAIHIEKHTNGLDADDEPGPIVPVGGTVTFTYTVTNTGNVPLPNVVVVDDAGTPDDITDDFSPSFVGGDENENGVLDPGEVWTYSATHIVTAGQYVNLGTVTAGDESTGTATASDLSHHFGAAAAIHIEKHTNGLDADDEPGPIVPVGGTVTFTYTVTNTGNVPLPNVVVSDDAGTPDDITDDFSPSFVGGDENENGVLDPGEAWTYSATHIVTAGQYVNLGTVTAGDENTGTATASDLSHHFGAAAAIHIEKHTNGLDADDEPGPIVPVGGTVTFTYTVTNTGNVPLPNVVVSDDAGTPDDITDDFSPSFVGGDENENGVLDPGEVWTYSATHIVTAGQYVNLGTVTAGDESTGTATASDLSHHFGAAAAIHIEKHTNGLDADDEPGPIVPVGGTVTFTYTVTNTGNVPLPNVVVVDDAGTPDDITDDFSPSFVGGDENENGVLDPGEAWTYSATHIVTAGQYVNLGTVTAGDENTGTATASDLSHHFGAAAAIHIEKHTNGLDADDEPGPIVPVGGTVTFTYTVTNTGNVPLPNVVVSDDAGTPDDITDDFSPSFVGGDENENGVLDPGEVWTYSATHIVTAGQYVNLGTVTAGDESTGTATASDLSHHFGAAAAIHIEKHTNGLDADDEPGPIVPVGGTVTFTYTVTNTGNVPLPNVVVSDDAGTPDDITDDFSPSFVGGDENENGVIDPGEAWTYSATHIVTAGQYVNLATVTAGDENTGTTTASDLSHHFGFQSITISGRKFDDWNGDGSDNGGSDPGLAGWTIFLDANNNGVLDPGEVFTMTSGDGSYCFNDLGPGTYIVRAVPQVGRVPTTAVSHTVVTENSQHFTARDFGSFKRITISGVAFNDFDGNGSQDDGEPLMGGWTIVLDTNNNGSLDPGEAFTITAGDGSYSFSNLGPGNYRVREVGQTGWMQTSPNPPVIEARSGSDVGNVDFGNKRNRRYDFNAPGTPTATNFVGVLPTTIFNATAGFGWQKNVEPFDRGTPNALLQDGHWGLGGPSAARTFSVVVEPNVTYQVKLHFRDEFARDQMNVVNLDNPAQGAFNIDVPANTTVTRTFLASAPDGILDLRISDAGGDPYWIINALEIIEHVPATSSTISGQVFLDANGNGVKNAGETGFNGAVVFLDANNNGTLDPGEVNTPTNSDGMYSFTNVPTGTHRVRVVPPSVHLQTSPVANLGSHVITITDPDTFANHDFGVNNQRWFDFNASPANTQSPYLGIQPTTTFNTSQGFGWQQNVESFDRGGPTNLLRDGHWGVGGTAGARSFQVFVGAGATVQVRAHFRDTFLRDHMVVFNANNTSQTTGQFTVPANTTVVRTFNATAGANGILNIRIQDNGGDYYWAINGLEVNAINPLQAEGGVSVSGEALPLLSTADLAPVVSEAIARWTNAGADASLLADVQFHVEDLAGPGYLGLAATNTVWLDDDAGGYGWFIDATPWDDSEFLQQSSGQFEAGDGSPAAGRMDLLTVVMHELGHVLGLPDLNPQQHPDALMSATLWHSLRRLPSLLPGSPLRLAASLPSAGLSGERGADVGAMDQVFGQITSLPLIPATDPLGSSAPADRLGRLPRDAERLPTVVQRSARTTAVPTLPTERRPREADVPRPVPQSALSALDHLFTELGENEEDGWQENRLAGK